MRVGLIGAGTIGTYLLNELYGEDQDIRITSVFVRNLEKYQHLEEHYGVQLYTSIDEFLDSSIDVVVEAANVQAAKEVLPDIVSKKETVLISIGALAEETFFDEIVEIMKEKDYRIHLPSGAIGGLDLVENVTEAGVIDTVSLVTRKPAHTLLSDSTDETKVVFEGNAAEAIKQFPKNINVSIALALAGVGLRQTKVTLLADPNLDKNIHSIQVSGEFGTASFEIKNNPFPSNKNTSYLAAVSVLGTLKKLTKKINIG
uniref:aspartate dehydrogenase n=1 Tax=uncultured Allobacillus sp. TaxID=1638025 RepID=UPI002595F7BF|nr:aspartate dehydrogenase [uncultured Allobacillus sp.]